MYLSMGNSQKPGGSGSGIQDESSQGDVQQSNLTLVKADLRTSTERRRERHKISANSGDLTKNQGMSSSDHSLNTASTQEIEVHRTPPRAMPQSDLIHNKHKELTYLRQLETMKEDYDSIYKRFADLMSTHSSTVSQLEVANEETNCWRKRYEDLMHECNNAMRERNALQQQCTAAIHKWDSALRERNEAKEQLAKCQQQRDEAMKEINQAMAIRIKASKDITRLTEERNAAIQEYSLIMSERESVHKDIERLQEELTQSQKLLESSEGLLKASLKELETIRRELSASTQQRDEAIQKYNDLQEKYASSLDETGRQTKHLKQRSDDLEQVNQELENLRRQHERLQRELVEAQQEAEVCKRRRDWAFSERDKIVLERESIRTLCDKLRRERDRAVSELAESLRDSDDIKRQRNEASKELKDLKDKLEAHVEKDSRLNSISNQSHDSAIDADLQDWDLETLQMELNVEEEEELGFEISGGKDDPQYPNDFSFYVTKIKAGGPAENKLRMWDCLTTVNGSDLNNLEKKAALEILNQAKPSMTLILRRHKHILNQDLHSVILQLSSDKPHGLTFESGLYVSRVEENSAAEGSLFVGDRIVKVNGQMVSSVTELNKQFANSIVTLLVSKSGFVKDHPEMADATVQTEKKDPPPVENTTHRLVAQPKSLPLPELKDEEDPIAELDSVLEHYGKTSSSSKVGNSNGGTWPKYRGPPIHQCGGTSFHAKKKKERQSLSSYTKHFEIFDKQKIEPKGEMDERMYLKCSPECSAQYGPPATSSPLGSPITHSTPHSSSSSYTSPEMASPHKASQNERFINPDYTVVSGHRDKDVMEFYKTRGPRVPHKYSSRPRSANYVHPSNDFISPKYPKPSLEYVTSPLYTTATPQSLLCNNLPFYTLPTSHNHTETDTASPPPPCPQFHYHHSPTSSMEMMLQPPKPMAQYNDGLSTFPKRTPRIRIPSNPSVTSKSSTGKVSNSSIDKVSMSERDSPLPSFSVEWLTPDKSFSGDIRNRKPKIGDMRSIYLEKSSEPLGIQIACGASGGIFVSSVNEHSLAAQAGVQVGDQLLEVCGINMRCATYDLAANVLRQCGESVTMLIQFNPDKYKNILCKKSKSSSSESKSSSSEDLSTSTASHKHSSGTTPDSSPSEPRVVILKKATSNLGISLLGGNAVGIFVHSVQEDSPASELEVGDQILEYNNIDLRHATAEEAAYELAKPAESVKILVKKDLKKFHEIQDKPGDAFYIRALVDRMGTTDDALSFHKEDILFVENTMYNGVPGLWQAWLVSPEGEKVKSGIIPSKFKIEEELMMSRSLGDLDSEDSRRSSTSARRSFFRRKKHQRCNSKDSKELASFSDVSISCTEIVGEELPVYQRIERLDCIRKRPVIIVGPLMEAVIDKLENDYPIIFQRCVPEILYGSLKDIEMGMKENRIVDYCRRGSHFECITTSSIVDLANRSYHALLDVSLSAVERLHKCQLYPIVVFLKYKSTKQIRDVKNLTKKVTTKAAKEMYEHALKLENEYKHFINASVQGLNFEYMCTQVKTNVDEEQRRPLWIPFSTKI
ncbi:DLG5 [Cordylochernes scorpioides]|uniref:DLG5 n=1 Tax=Cordylochernes scorpioides TaxID=51811 RepID=A0ABY6JXD9_9ARAC|nr:DLG5 [Cordylochernes scorpioides]